MKKILQPVDVLIAILTYYVNTECKNPEDFNAIISAKFIDNDGTIEIDIENADRELLN